MKQADCYHKWVAWSEEDVVSIGRCPDFITGLRGDTRVEVYRDLEETVCEVVEHFPAKARPLPEPRVRPVAVSVAA